MSQLARLTPPSDAAAARAGRVRVGLDVGGTKIDGVIVDDDEQVIARKRAQTGAGPTQVVDNCAQVFTALCAENGVAPSELITVGIGIPGLVDSATGTVQHAVNLGIENLGLAETLGRRIGHDVVVENDVKAAALGADAVLGLGGSLAYLNVGTGLAAGIVVNGELWRGSHGVAGEIGHIPADPGLLPCPCGQRGCLETVASGSALARAWQTDDKHPARAVFSAARSGDSRAQKIRDRFAEGVAACVRMIALTYDVRMVVLGGGLSNLGEELLNLVRRTLTEWAAESAFLAALGLPGRVTLVAPNSPVAAIGAARLTPLPAK